ncbi:MAG: IS1182 family transposase, partial [Dehalococcoidia bacterium]|nr:IS1182 family transposase [Dehalococcoidia bacterium]
RLDRYEAAEQLRLENESGLPVKALCHDKPKQLEMTERRASTTDPEAGFLHRPGKPHGMHYLDHQSIDAKNGIIVDVAVTPGNATDASPYLDRIQCIRDFGITIEAVGVDSAYDISLVHQELSESNIEIYTPKNNEVPQSKVEFKREDFRYDDKEDVFVCPAGNRLALKQLNRSEWNVSHEYLAKRPDCRNCLLREKCLAPSQKCRRLQVNIFEAAVKNSHKKDGAPEHRRALALRQIW